MAEKLTKEETELIDKIGLRLIIKAGQKSALQFSELEDMLWQIKEDLKHVHLYLLKLDLKGLSESDDFNLFHDCFGIMNNVDRHDFKLLNHFRPRFALKERASNA